MKKIYFLFFLALLALFVPALLMPSAMAESPERDISERPKQAELENDPELAELVDKYEKLLHEQSLSADELAELIAKDENEKAKFLGIQTTYQAESGDKTKERELLGLCIHPPWGGGKVNWNFPNPGQNGAGYLVKPEHTIPLIWANPPEQWIDGIYRSSWGSCNAFKVPGSATATFSNAESWGVCYNAAACIALKKCPKWVNPCDNNSPEDNWPDEPLQ